MRGTGSLPEIRRLGPDDLDQYFDVRAQSFGIEGSNRVEWRALLDAVPEAPAFGAFAGSRLLGALRVLPAAQYLLGRSVPMGGLAGVVVRPEARGLGVARSLMATSLTWMHAEGIVVSSLHPASTRVYRSMGWEIAGRAGSATVGADRLAAIRGERAGAVEALTDADHDAVRACHHAVSEHRHGAIDRSHAFWALHEHGGRQDGAFLYGVRAGGTLAGYVAYTQHPRRDWGYSLTVDDFAALDRATAVALWHFIGAHSFQVRQVRVPLFLVPELVLLLDEQHVSTEAENRWMHRIVDLPGAMAARGFSPALKGSVTVEVTDPWAGGTAGAWRLEVADGTGAAERVETAELRTDVGALSALAIGGFSASQLVAAGRLHGPEGKVAMLAGLLGAPPPQITDDF
ncbi:MAG: GNAT family N-acetyltransferase [Acidimicrobiia bacterium]